MTQPGSIDHEKLSKSILLRTCGERWFSSACWPGSGGTPTKVCQKAISPPLQRLILRHNQAAEQLSAVPAPPSRKTLLSCLSSSPRTIAIHRREVRDGGAESGAGRNPDDRNGRHRRNAAFLRSDANLRPHREGFRGCDLSVRAQRISRCSQFIARNSSSPSVNTSSRNRMQRTCHKAQFRVSLGRRILARFLARALGAMEHPRTGDCAARIHRPGRRCPGDRLARVRLHHRAKCSPQLDGPAGYTALHHRGPLHRLGARSDLSE